MKQVRISNVKYRSLADAARALGCSRQYVWQLIRKRRRECVICGATKSARSTTYCDRCLKLNRARKQKRRAS
jgi:hypothetical protein